MLSYELHLIWTSHLIQSKILLLLFKAVHNIALVYLQQLIHQYIRSRSVRSSGGGFLTLHLSKISSMGGKSFTVVISKLWNSLPQLFHFIVKNCLDLETMKGSINVIYTFVCPLSSFITA